MFFWISVSPPQHGSDPQYYFSLIWWLINFHRRLKKTYMFFQWKHLNSCWLKQEKAHLNSRTATSHTTTTYPSSQREIPDTHTWNSQSALSNVDFKSDKTKTKFDLIQKLWQRERVVRPIRASVGSSKPRAPKILNIDIIIFEPSALILKVQLQNECKWMEAVETRDSSSSQ